MMARVTQLILMLKMELSLLPMASTATHVGLMESAVPVRLQSLGWQQMTTKAPLAGQCKECTQRLSVGASALRRTTQCTAAPAHVYAPVV